MDEGAKTFHCTFDGCTGAFGSEAGLKAHTLRHTSSFPCGRCEKKFNAKSDLERHVAAIHENQHFQCEEPGCRRADKPFSRLDSLQRHLHKVHGKRPGVDDAFSPVPVHGLRPLVPAPPAPAPDPPPAAAVAAAAATATAKRPAKRRLVDPDSDTPEPGDRSGSSSGGSRRERLLAERVGHLEADLAELKNRHLEMMESHAEELRDARELYAKEMSEQRAMSRDLMDIIKTMSKDKA